MLSFVRNHHPVFQNGCTIFHSHQQWMRIPIVPHSYQYLVMSAFRIFTIVIRSIFHCYFNLLSLMIIWCVAYFCMFTCHLCILLSDVSVKILAPFLKIGLFSYCLVLEFFVNIGKQSSIIFIRPVFGKYFFQDCSLSFTEQKF